MVCLEVGWLSTEKKENEGGDVHEFKELAIIKLNQSQNGALVDKPESTRVKLRSNMWVVWL